MKTLILKNPYRRPAGATRLFESNFSNAPVYIANPFKKKKAFTAPAGSKPKKGTSMKKKTRRKAGTARNRKTASRKISTKGKPGYSKKAYTKREVVTLSKRYPTKSNRKKFGIKKNNFTIHSPIGGTFKELTSRETLFLAGGVIAAPFISQQILTRFGSKLPGTTNPYVLAGYTLAIPFLGAVLTQKFSKPLAKGMLLGGLAAFVMQLVNATRAGTTAATAEYLGRSTGTGEYLGNSPAPAPVSRLGYTPTGEYLGDAPQGVDSLGAAFSNNAWSRN